MTIQPPATAETVKTRQLRIDIWGDIVCPWCYIGRARLAKAVTSSPHSGSIVVADHSFELDPNASTEPKPTLEFLAAKMGVSIAEAEGMEGHVAGLAEAEGLPYSVHRLHGNTFDLHRVVHLAGVHGVADRLLALIQRELFSGRANVFDHAWLVDAAGELGVPKARTAAVLAGDEYTDAVRQDEEQARRLGVTGVPFAVIDGRYGIPGATSVDGYAQAIEQAWGE